MQGKDFLYFFTDELNRSFHVQNGLVSISSTPVPLEFTPGEWQNIIVDNTRNQKYFALDRNFTIPLNVVEDGGLILKSQYYKLGTEAIVNLVILKQQLFYDGTEYGYYYASFYKGEFDFSTFNHSGEVVTITVMEGGLPKLIKAKENIEYEIPIDHPDREWIKMDGIVLKEAARFSMVTLELKKSITTSWYTAPMIFLNSDSSITPGVTFFSPNIEGIAVFSYYQTSLNFLAQAKPDNPGPVFLKWTGQLIYRVVRNSPNNGIRLRFYTSRQSSSNQNLYLLTNTVPAGGSTVGVTYTTTVNITVPLQPGENLFFDIQYIGSSGEVSIIFSEESNLKVEYDFRYKDTYIKCLKPFTVFSELIKKITDGQYIPQSNLLTLWDNFKLTCGDAIRGLDNAIMVTSLSDFFKWVDVNLDTAMGMMAGILRLEYKADFVDYLNPIQLGSVKDLSVKPAKEYLYNTILTGQQDVTYDNVNGKQEYNSRFQWSTPLTRVAKELDRLSPYREDSYGIEFIRINLEGKTTTDSSGDKDVFAIHTKKKPYGFRGADGDRATYEIDRTLNVGATGLIEPATPFNMIFTPARKLHRSSRFIHSLFYKQDFKSIVFQTAGKNKELAAGGIVEKGSTLIGNLGKEYFTPNELTFVCPAPVDLVDLLEASPVRAFQFEYLGVTLQGIALKVGIKAGDYEAQTHTLLSGPDNNLEELINIFE